MKKLIIALLICSTVFGQQVEYKLVWEENFDGETLNDQAWNIDIGNGCPFLCGWGNNERQLYANENYKIANGNLVITAQKNGDQYTSARINTKSKKEFQYGRIETLAKLPVGRGLWPTFFMLGSNYAETGWPKSGEVDILEYVGREPNIVFTTVHTQSSHGNSINSKKTTIPDIEEGFHLYAIEWTKDKIDFFVDKDLVYTYQPAVKNVNNWPFDQPFFLILNIAVGGNFGGPTIDDTIFPQEFSVDYIKVYQ